MSEPTRRWHEASAPTDRRPRHAMGCRPSGLTHIQQVRSVFQQVLGLLVLPGVHRIIQEGMIRYEADQNPASPAAGSGPRPAAGSPTHAECALRCCLPTAATAAAAQD